MINTKIKVTNMELTDVIQTYAEEKMSSVERLLGKDSDALIEIELEKTTNHHKQGDIFRAEANVTIEGKLYRVEATKDDLYAAVDKVKKELFRTVRRRKNRHTAMVRRGSQAIKGMMKRFKR